MNFRPFDGVDSRNNKTCSAAMQERREFRRLDGKRKKDRINILENSVVLNRK